MKIFKTYRFLFTIAVVVLMVSACKTVAVLPTKTPVKNVNIAALTTKIKANYPRIGQLRSRIKATYFDGKREQQIIVLLRMKDNNVIWMSATMLIPIAKLMLTKEKVSFFEKFQKTYFEGDFDFLNAPYKTDFNYTDFQNLLLGIPFSDPAAGRWKQISNPQYYILEPQDRKGFQPTLFFDPVSFLLKEQRLLIPGTTQNLSIKYLNHIKVEGSTLPQQIAISLFDGSTLKRLDLEFSRIDFPDALTFPFDVPEGYQPIAF
ncbi:DUF4292 domain-containing protein [Flavobacteriaceae bacterium]|nr:DUF4292 domain-containing protein [Flavobacteriaceae bacterium]